MKHSAAAILLSLIALFGVSEPACAFGTEGHEVVALVAEKLLTPEARRRVDSISAVEPGATLASISNWADQTRDRSTAAWHYVNMPRDAGCVFDAKRDCPDGKCIVMALQAQVQRLSDPSIPDLQKLEALKYVVHLVADIHQPLHAGFADDRGGNTYQLQAFGRGTNLHALWDTALLQAIEPSATRLAGELLSLRTPEASLAFEPAAWAAESCRLVNRPDFYPVRGVEPDYLQAFQSVLLSQLQLAAHRLAATLETVLVRRQ